MKVILSAKERDAIDTMTEYWLSSGIDFKTRNHGKFKGNDQWKLIGKMKMRQVV